MSFANTKRKHVTSACHPCRESKVKCDGQHPICSNCLKKSKECRYNVKDDKRRVSLRSAVDILSERVALLTKTLVTHNIRVPPMNQQQKLCLQEICDTLHISLHLSSDHMSSDHIDNHGPAESELDHYETRDISVGYAQPEGQVPHRDSSQVVQQAETQTFDLPGPTAAPVDTQDTWSISDGPPTDSGIMDWPWEMFEWDEFLLSEIGGTNFADTSIGAGAIHSEQEFGAVRPSSDDRHEDNREVPSSDEEQEPDVVRQVSARLGSLRMSSDGHLRFFGAVTNYHLLGGSRHDDDLQMFTTKHEILGRLEQAGMNHEIPATLESHLIDLFFTWHNPSHVPVDRDTFTAARNDTSSSAHLVGYAGEFLINAVCAIGAAYETRYHPTFVTYPRSLAEYFASKAKLLLEADLERPSISTIQGLCLLSSYEAARGRDARTWLYGGMAMRLCFDLGLHVDCAPYVKTGVLTTADAHARQSTFWSCVVLNHLSSVHFGRPFRIDSEEITVQGPGNMEINSDNHSHEQQMNETAELPSTDFVLQQWVFLCEKLMPLIRKLYGSSSTPIADLQRVSSNVTKELQSWWHNLSPSLRIREGFKSRSEILLLHMAYHHFQILIHRPWTSRGAQPHEHRRAGTRHARQACSASASAIARLLLRYENDHGFQRMHDYAVNIIFSAALISLFNVLAGGTNQQSDVASTAATADLSIFFRALDDLSRSFDSAKRAREHLATIQRSWYLSGSVHISGAKRQQESSEKNRGRKRIKQAVTMDSAK